MWDREINDNQIDHFGALLSNAEAKRGLEAQADDCFHRTDRIIG